MTTSTNTEMYPNKMLGYTKFYEVYLDEKNGVTKATIRTVIMPEGTDVMTPRENEIMFRTKEEAREWAKQYELDHAASLEEIVTDIKTNWANNFFYGDGIKARLAAQITPAAEVAKVIEVLDAICLASPFEFWAPEVHDELNDFHRQMTEKGEVKRPGKKTGTDAKDALIDIYCQLVDEHRCRSAIHEVNVLRSWCFRELSLAEVRLSDGTAYDGLEDSGDE